LKDVCRAAHLSVGNVVVGGREIVDVGVQVVPFVVLTTFSVRRRPTSHGAEGTSLLSKARVVVLTASEPRSTTTLRTSPTSVTSDEVVTVLTIGGSVCDGSSIAPALKRVDSYSR